MGSPNTNNESLPIDQICFVLTNAKIMFGCQSFQSEPYREPEFQVDCLSSMANDINTDPLTYTQSVIMNRRVHENRRRATEKVSGHHKVDIEQFNA